MENEILWLIKIILANHAVGGGEQKRGMPLGNRTSQFFANVYLNELDYFVKNVVRAEFYIRYVDDFVILESDKNKLMNYQKIIDGFLKETLKIELHPCKSKIIKLGNKINFLEFRVFYYHKLLKKSNIRKMRRTFNLFREKYEEEGADYDEIYDFFEGWLAYAINADACRLRQKIAEDIEKAFPNEISTKEIDKYLKID